MKKQRNPEEMRALAAGQRRGYVASAIGLAVGLLFLVLAPEFHAANCVLMLTLATMGGMMSGRTAAGIHLLSAGRAGRTGGTLATFGFAIPFVISYSLQAATLSEAGVARLLGTMDPAQMAAISRAGLAPGMVYFQQQYVSFIGAYVIFAALFGQVQGGIGGLVGRRSQVAAAR